MGIAEEHDVMTLDADPMVHPDLVCCLGRDAIPLPDESVDAAIAIHVLEHIGKTGETADWFFFWEDIYRVLKPHGRLEFISPKWDSVWAWADPSHVRLISPESFYFFQQANYGIPGNPISPFRIRCDFRPGTFQDTPNGNFGGVLIANKPLNPWWEDSVCQSPALSASPAANPLATHPSTTN